MLNRVTRSSFDRFLPLIIGVLAILTSLILGKISEPHGFQFVAVSTFPLIGAISSWFTFGSTRLWIRYLVFIAAFFAMPFLIAVFKYEPDSYMFSGFAVMLAILNQLLKIGGMRIQKVYNYREEGNSQSITPRELTTQFTIRDLLQLTLFIAVTFAGFGLWRRAWGVDWTLVSRLVTGERQIIAFYILNVISILTALAKRKILVWLVLDAIVVYCALIFVSYAWQAGRYNGTNFIIMLNICWLTTYSIPRVFGYRWTWQSPFRIRSRETININAKQIAEPPIVASRQTPPSLPNSDE